MSTSLKIPLLLHSFLLSNLIYFSSEFIEVKVKDVLAFTLVEVTRKQVQILRIPKNTPYLIP